MNSMIDKLLRTSEFATLPALTMKILSMLENDDDLNIKELARVVETEPALSLKLIQVSNSPLFAIHGEISSIYQAILTLGLNRVTNLVLGISIFSKFVLSSKEGIKEIIEKYWWHTSSTGMVSKSLAKRLNQSFKEYEFIGGLLHDIGKLAMMQYDIELYKKVINLVENEKMRDIDAEKEIFGVDHAEVGAGIAKTWRLPKSLAIVLQYHTAVVEAPKEYQDLVAIVNIANMLCQIWDAGFYEGYSTIEFAKTPEWDIITNLPGQSDLDIEAVTFELETDYKNSQAFLDIMNSKTK